MHKDVSLLYMYLPETNSLYFLLEIYIFPNVCDTFKVS
jgi:hypothetical protein